MRRGIVVLGAVAVLTTGWALWTLTTKDLPTIPVVRAKLPLPARSVVWEDRPASVYDDDGPDVPVAARRPALEPISAPDLEAQRLSEAKRCARTGGDATCSFLDPSPDELREMARCGTVKIDYPDGLLSDGPFKLNESLARAASVDASERERIEKATEEFRAGLKQQLVPILREFGVDDEAIATATLKEAVETIQAREVLDQLYAARRELARGRAGLASVGAPRSPTERFEHIFVTLGDTYLSSLARTLGAERAADLRSVGDGWGASIIASVPCDEPDGGTSSDD